MVKGSWLDFGHRSSYELQLSRWQSTFFYPFTQGSEANLTPHVRVVVGPARRGEWGLASSGLINMVRWYQMCTAFRGEEEQLEETRNSSYSCQDYSREYALLYPAANRIYPALGMKG